MKRSKPPALATWFLEHDRLSTTDCVIAGDLLEEFQGTLSSMVLAPSAGGDVVGCTSEVRDHWVLAPSDPDHLASQLWRPPAGRRVPG